jgi:HSP20 family protein
MMQVMRSRIQAVVLPSEATAFGDEVRRIFAELGRLAGDEGLIGECSPPIDVFERDDTVEITMDLPGVDPSAIRVVAKGDAVLLAGEKTPRRVRGDSSFHLVERGYGRFAREIHLPTACDARRARATFAEGELRVTLPKVTNRRGEAIRIPLSTESPST